MVHKWIIFCVLVPLSLSTEDEKLDEGKHVVSFEVVSDDIDPRPFKIPLICSYSKLSTDLKTFKIVQADPIDACAEIKNNEAFKDTNVAGLTRRGTCKFTEKTCAVSKAGGKLAIIMNDQEGLSMGGMLPTDCKHIPACAVSRETGEKLMKILESSKSLTVKVQRFEDSVYDPAMIVCWLWACFIAGLSAIYGVNATTAARERRSRPVNSPSTQQNTGSSQQQSIPPQEDEMQIMTVANSLHFVIVSSTMLTVLYFFINQLVYILIFMFSVGSINALAHITTPYVIPFFGTKVMSIPQYGPLTRSELITTCFYSIFVIYWFITRKTSSHSWILQDMMGAAMCLRTQEVMKLPNIRVATYLLGMFFFYDIFFVFITPYIFEKSIMMHVGTGGNTGERMPMLFIFPKLSSTFYGENLLGLGDVVFPAFLLTYLRGFDIKNNISFWDGYYLRGLYGYASGLAVTMAILVIFESGQPALLYLVPSCLGFTYHWAYKRTEMSILWNDTFEALPSINHNYEQPECQDLIDASAEENEIEN